MGAKESAETRAGLALLAQGYSVRKAAQEVGVAPSTLTRAKARTAQPGTRAGVIQAALIRAHKLKGPK